MRIALEQLVPGLGTRLEAAGLCSIVASSYSRHHRSSKQHRKRLQGIRHYAEGQYHALGVKQFIKQCATI
jgi:hypothetical protein